MRPERSAELSSELRRNYERDGVAYPVTVMSTAEAAHHYSDLLEIEARHGPMHYRVKPYLLSVSAFQIATNAALLDAVEAIIGPDILLWDSSFVIKEAGSSQFVSWHQDLTYWGLDMSTDDDLASAWVALTPATRGNGCMQFVRGSHKAGELAHVDTYDETNILHRGQSIADEYAEEDISQIELAAGQASLHHGWAVHSSNPNTSAERRVGLVMNFVKPNVRQVVGDAESATLVRGEDRIGNFRDESACERDFDVVNVAFQLDIETRKRDVYDTA